MHHSRGRPLWEVDQWLSISCLREICCRFATYVSFTIHTLVQEIRYMLSKSNTIWIYKKNPTVFPTNKSCICHSCFPLNSVFFEAPCRHQYHCWVGSDVLSDIPGGQGGPTTREPTQYSIHYPCTRIWTSKNQGSSVKFKVHKKGDPNLQKGSLIGDPVWHSVTRGP